MDYNFVKNNPTNEVQYLPFNNLEQQQLKKLTYALQNQRQHSQKIQHLLTLKQNSYNHCINQLKQLTHLKQESQKVLKLRNNQLIQQKGIMKEIILQMQKRIVQLINYNQRLVEDIENQERFNQERERKELEQVPQLQQRIQILCEQNQNLKKYILVKTQNQKMIQRENECLKQQLRLKSREIEKLKIQRQFY